MIWALAGLGDEPRAITSVDTSDFYSPTTAAPPLPPPSPVRDENASGPATPPVTAGIDMTMVIGVVAVVGVVGLMLSRGGMTANGKRRWKRKKYAGYKGKYRAGVTGSTRVKLILHMSGRGGVESSLKKALADLRYSKLKPGKVRRYTIPGGRKSWGITVRTTVAKADSFMVKLRKSRVQSYEAFIH